MRKSRFTEEQMVRILRETDAKPVADGILWPEAISPFQLILVALNHKNDPALPEAIEALYSGLQTAGVDVLLDDRDLYPGLRFADAAIIGIPHRIAADARGFGSQALEYKHRGTEAASDIGWSVQAVLRTLDQPLH